MQHKHWQYLYASKLPTYSCLACGEQGHLLQWPDNGGGLSAGAACKLQQTPKSSRVNVGCLFLSSMALHQASRFRGPCSSHGSRVISPSLNTVLYPSNPWISPTCSLPTRRSRIHSDVVQTNSHDWQLRAAGLSSQSIDTSATSSLAPGSLNSYEDPYTFVPEDYELPAGVLSQVDRTLPAAPEDAFRCIGCTRPECQVRIISLSTVWITV